MIEVSNTNIIDPKAKIRERYRNQVASNIEIIPAIEKPGFYEDFSEKRVAVYARVSTGSINQTSSYELQKGYYEKDVSRHPGWKLVRIYADEGISGTSLKHRDEFVQMITDCEAGLIDLIVTKSVSRFSRNVLDCIGEVRKLASLPHPVGVFFETENIYTLNRDSEMSLSFVSTLAQEESHTKSRSMDRSLDMRFSMGIFLTPALLGYDIGDDKKLVINENEALTVRLCFFMYLYGYGCQQIAETLMKLGRRTKPGNLRWTANAVLAILQNERHCGDILARKTWTPSYLDHKVKKNKNAKRQYYATGDHEPIISRDDFIAVQRTIANAKYGHKGLLPSLHIIPSGMLQGFIEINPRWAGFTPEDYYDAAESISNTCENVPEMATVKETSSVFDLSGYEIARGDFFQTSSDVFIIFSISDVLFSKTCIHKLHDTEIVEILYEPYKKLLAVRTTSKENKHHIQWAHIRNKQCSVKPVCGAAFLPTLFTMLEWNNENRYRILGSRRQNSNETVLLFDLNETEIYVPACLSDEMINENNQLFNPFHANIIPISRTFRQTIVASPSKWAESFGRQAAGGSIPIADAIEMVKPWLIDAEGVPYQVDHVIHPSTKEDLHDGIEKLVASIRRNEGSHG